MPFASPVRFDRGSCGQEDGMSEETHEGGGLEEHGLEEHGIEEHGIEKPTGIEEHGIEEHAEPAGDDDNDE
jgi:hypothetical protein